MSRRFVAFVRRAIIKTDFAVFQYVYCSWLMIRFGFSGQISAERLKGAGKTFTGTEYYIESYTQGKYV